MNISSWLDFLIKANSRSPNAVKLPTNLVVFNLAEIKNKVSRELFSNLSHQGDVSVIVWLNQWWLNGSLDTAKMNPAFTSSSEAAKCKNFCYSQHNVEPSYPMINNTIQRLSDDITDKGWDRWINTFSQDDLKTVVLYNSRTSNQVNYSAHAKITKDGLIEIELAPWNPNWRDLKPTCKLYFSDNWNDIQYIAGQDIIDPQYIKNIRDSLLTLYEDYKQNDLAPNELIVEMKYFNDKYTDNPWWAFIDCYQWNYSLQLNKDDEANFWHEAIVMANRKAS